MHNFKYDSSLKEYKGKTIISVGINFNYYDIIFDELNKIRIFSVDSFYHDNNVLFEINGDRLKLAEITNNVVSDVEILSETKAKIILEGGISVYLSDEFDEYESLEMHLDGGVIPI